MSETGNQEMIVEEPAVTWNKTSIGNIIWGNVIV